MTRSSGDPQRNELGDFLKARRSTIGPTAVGLPAGDRRRVPGLRREEVAVLAAISTDYYTRLEQGRIQASTSVLESLARVLQLDPDQRRYLFDLATRSPAPVRHVRARTAAQPRLQRVLDNLVHTPAFVIGRHTEVVAWNALGAALITDFARIPAHERYFVTILLTDPAMRDLYVDWEGVTRLAIAQLRMHNTLAPHDTRLARLVGELSLKDARFRAWWAGHDVAIRDTGSKHLRHPVVGDLHLDWNAVTWAADTDLELILWTAEPGSPSHERLQVLSAWSTRPASTPDPGTGLGIDPGPSRQAGSR